MKLKASLHYSSFRSISPNLQQTSLVCKNDATLMDGTQGYKYLGIIENNKSEDTGETA
ncbi:hypothetical protein NUSPORA_02246 [Nucleospora cyclopteri]